uniref:Uncharacterized protein n=1 Tax=Tanacetum cinerariifolium TaxID=118510 RepID=A0A6L2NQR4_TANCI|nr:hypothetical protein [Tanacetum cinerariifolium]
MLGAAGVQIPKNNLDNLHSSREEDGTLKFMDLQDLLGSFLLANIDLITLDLLTGSVVLDFLDVPAIYMQEFWATVSVYKSSIRFRINKKKVSLDVEIFREILQICLKIPRQEFEDLPIEHDILSFISDLGHTKDITYLIDVNKPVQATKGTRIKTKAKVAKSDKKKQPAKTSKAKGLAVLSEQQKIGIDEGTSTIPGVLDVPIYDYESNKESWGDSDEEDDNKDEFEEEANINDDDSDDNDESDDERKI